MLLPALLGWVQRFLVRPVGLAAAALMFRLFPGGQLSCALQGGTQAGFQARVLGWLHEAGTLSLRRECRGNHHVDHPVHLPT